MAPQAANYGHTTLHRRLQGLIDQLELVLGLGPDWRPKRSVSQMAEGTNAQLLAEPTTGTRLLAGPRVSQHKPEVLAVSVEDGWGTVNLSSTPTTLSRDGLEPTKSRLTEIWNQNKYQPRATYSENLFHFRVPVPLSPVSR